MKLKLVAVSIGIAGLLITSSCATAPKPLDPGEVRLLGMVVPEKENIKLHSLFIVSFSFEAEGEPEIKSACFYFADDGPHCYRVTDVNYGLRGTIKVQVRNSNAGAQLLRGYVVYVRDGKVQRSNMVSTHFRTAAQ